jgi:ABC-type branched-subunit amino acid transport system substrate-binding protein
MNNNRTRRDFCATAVATIAASAMPAPWVWAAEKKYDSGASDTEIKLGQTVPHSGPGSLYGVLGRVGEAYFQMLNDKGGINGRKIKFFTMDDAYSAPKCVEATRRLVEQEEVLALFGSLGTAPQTAVHKYLNAKGVPQLLLNTGASKWNDPKNNKWTMAGLPLYPTEARILARHVVNVKPNAKVGILYQNDDFGRDFLGPFKKVLEDAGSSAKVIMEQTYDLTDPTIDSQLINLSKSGADVFYNITTGKATSQSIRKVAELGWKPLQLLSAGSTGRSILNAAGFDNATGIVAIRYAKEVGVPRWEKDPDVMAFEALRKAHRLRRLWPGGDDGRNPAPLRRRPDPCHRPEAGVKSQRLPLALFSRRHHLQLHARRLHADENALYLRVQRQGLGHFRQAGHGVVRPEPMTSNRLFPRHGPASPGDRAFQRRQRLE